MVLDWSGVLALIAAAISIGKGQADMANAQEQIRELRATDVRRDQQIATLTSDIARRRDVEGVVVRLDNLYRLVLEERRGTP